MLDRTSQEAVTASVSEWESTFHFPLYETYCFSNLGGTVQHLLTGGAGTGGRSLPASVFGSMNPRAQCVILFLIDGLSFDRFERAAATMPFLKRFLDLGVVSAITSQFPSTTAAEMTTLHSGLTVGESGLYEWRYFEPHPRVNGVIEPLPFSFAGDEDRETLLGLPLRGSDILPPSPFYGRLSERGIDSACFQNAAYVESTYSRHMLAGARRIPFTETAAALDCLRRELLGRPVGALRYYVVYLDEIDVLSHRHGPDSAEVWAALAGLDASLEAFYRAVAGRVLDTVLLVASDHGQTAINPAETLYINLAMPDIERFLRKDGKGRPILFGGSCRDLFLYPREECLAEFEGRLKEVIAGRATVCRTENLIARGFFGTAVGTRLRQRIGELVVLPYAGGSVYWWDPPRFVEEDLGAHGGLSYDEMVTAFGFLHL